MASALELTSNALILLGDQPISSFTDGSTGSLLAAHLYDSTYEAMLSETLWHFATKVGKLARLVEEPKNNFSYKFQLPQDCIYVVKADVGMYDIYERTLFANAQEVQIEYVYRVDEINLPVYFAKALEYNLASQFAIPLTGNASRGDFYRQLYELELKKAKRADASQRPPYQMGDDRLVTARYF